jgi:NADH dehydrogenase
MQDKKEHVVIIGGGFGGIAVAKKLRKSSFQITLIDKSNHHLFQPLLYQVATAALSPGDIAAPIRAVLGENSGVKVIMGKVEKVKPDNKTVILHDGRTITYDRLVMAPGAQYNYFGNEDWEQHAPGLKSVSDALNIRERILLSLEEAEQLEDPALREPYLTYVIIGGGPTGVEMAGAIAEIAKRQMMRDFQNISENETRVFLVEAGPKILAGYSDELSEKARLMLEDMGVRVLLNTPVTDIEKNRIHFKEGSVETPNIIWAAGVSASPLMNTLGVAQNKAGRVKVTKDLRVPEYPEIYVVGDAAYLEDEKGNPLPALAPVALQQGKFVGDQILSAKKASESAAFSYKDKGMMATIGRAKAVADVHGWKLSGFSAWFMWSFVHILFLICFHNKMRVFVEWMLYYFTFKRGVRLITDRLECAYCGEPGILFPDREPEFSHS